MYSLHTEQELLNLFNSGDKAAFDEISSRYYPQLYSTALAITEQPHLAENAVQEVLEKAYEKLHEYRGDSLLLTWLRKLLINHICNRQTAQ